MEGKVFQLEGRREIICFPDSFGETKWRPSNSGTSSPRSESLSRTSQKHEERREAGRRPSGLPPVVYSGMYNPRLLLLVVLARDFESRRGEILDLFAKRLVAESA